MPHKDQNLICIACSIFKRELEMLQDRGDLDIEVRYLDSMLHIYPDKLYKLLESVLQREVRQDRQILLLFGGCHPFMKEQETLPGVSRVQGMNCIEIMLGHDKYKRLRKEGAFILLPEWTQRWREIFNHELGLNQKVAKDFMGDLHTKLIYLDTGLIAIPHDKLEALSSYTGLVHEIMPVDLGNLLTSIRKTMEGIN